jgi:translation initiation factor IF-3
MLFKHKSTVKVDMADLDAEKTNLSNFLSSQYKLNSTVTPKGLELNMEDVQTYSLVTMVKKFIHHKNLSSTHGVNAENNVVKIYRFKGTTKKKEKHDKGASHQNITQSWGL